MLFTSFIFLQIFLPIVNIVTLCLKNIKHKNIFLLAASLIFYAWGEPHNIFLLIISLIFNFFIAQYGLAFEKADKSRKYFLIAGLLFNIIILFIFKYTTPIVLFLDNIFHFDFKISKIALPLGISFFTFQIISYLLDVYQKENKPQKNFFDLSLYIMFFPQLVAGPIVKYHDIAEQLAHRTQTWSDYAYGIRRFIYGLGKKVLIANQMAYIADDIFLIPGHVLDTKTAYLGIIAYSLQIYFDFSGYSDMAIGLGRMLGFRFKENFNLPYTARSVQDFWRRWHISLSTWFKEYLYIPLGGNRISVKRTYFNIMIVFTVTGIWHGAGLNFVVWGAYYGILLILERWKLKYYLDKPALLIPAHIYTLLAVMTGWVFFRAENLQEGAVYCSKLFVFSNNANLPVGDFLTIASGGLILIAILLSGLIQKIKYFSTEVSRETVRWYDFVILPLILAAALSLLAGNTYNPFIYFRF